ncbi:MAG: phosphatase PAP2 family protein [Thermodesulfobacteriota bacterium]
MDALARFDASLFHIINRGLSNPFFDFLMPFITDKSHLVFVILAAALLVFFKGRRRDVRGLVLVLVTVLVSDFFSSTFKNVFLRVRPCHGLEDVLLLVGCGGSYSMPSGHATNIFAAMVLLSTRYKKFTPLFLLLAAAVAYSRVYVGVHYPLDVIAGAALGTVCAFVFSELDRRVFQSLINHYRQKREYFEV